MEYTYTIVATDPEDDQIYYKISWGDETLSDWLGPYDSDTEVEVSYTWSKRGNYEIKVKAKDTKFAYSEWSDPLSISMPKNKPYINSPFLNFLQNYPCLFSMLRFLLKL